MIEFINNLDQIWWSACWVVKIWTSKWDKAWFYFSALSKANTHKLFHFSSKKELIVITNNCICWNLTRFCWISVTNLLRIEGSWQTLIFVSDFLSCTALMIKNIHIYQTNTDCSPLKISVTQSPWGTNHHLRYAACIWSVPLPRPREFGPPTNRWDQTGWMLSEGQQGVESPRLLTFPLRETWSRATALSDSPATMQMVLRTERLANGTRPRRTSGRNQQH